MGVGGGKGAPAPPNFSQMATPTQNNAVGAQSAWSQDPSGQWTQNSGFGGQAGDAVKSMQGQLAGAWGQPLDNGAQARTGAESAIYGSETSRLDPRFQQGEQQLQTQLANQGLAPGSEAYNNAYGNFQRSKNDAYQQAQYGAVMGGGQEAQRQQQMDLTSRFAPEQGLQGMLGMSGQAPNPLLPAAIAQYQGALQNYGIQQQGKNSMMGGLTGLGGALGAAKILAPAAAASGAAQKTAIMDTGGFIHGVREVHFEYKDLPGQKYRGVLAEDVAKVFPNESTTTPDGRKWVSQRFRPEVIKAMDDGELPLTAAQLRLDRIEQEAADEVDPIA